MKSLPDVLDLILPLVALGLAVFWLTTRVHLGPDLWLAAGTYFISHLLRIVRLVMFFIFEKPSLTKLSSTHAWSSWLSAVVPFKLGELARAWAITRLAHKPADGIAAYATEKVLDAVVLLAAILALASGGYPDAAISLLASVLVAVILVGFAAYLTSRATSNELRQLILASSNSKRGLHALILLNAFDATFRAFRQMMGGRVLLLLLLTLVIWAFDFATFYFIALHVNSAPGEIAGFVDMFKPVLLQSAFSPWYADYWNVVALTLSAATIPATLHYLYQRFAHRHTAKATYHIVSKHKRYSGETP